MFLEERISTCADYGSALGDRFEVEEVVTKNGNDYRRLLHPYPIFRFEIGYTGRQDEWIYDEIVDLFHRVGGRFGGFRAKNPAEFSTNDYRDPPTFSDQQLTSTSTAGVYQFVRWYGAQGNAEATRRILRKLVADTPLIGIRDESDNNVQVVQGSRWTVDVNTGLVTFAANKTDAIVGISQASQAVVDFGAAHPFITQDTVHLSSVAGMTQINGLRGTVVNTTTNTITLNINSSGFSAYSSGGVANTRPQSGETVIGGCEFDIPCRFEDDISGLTFSNWKTLGLTINIVELLNP